MKIHVIALVFALSTIAPGWGSSAFDYDRAGTSDLGSADPSPPLTNLDVLRFLILQSRAKMEQNYQRAGKRAASSSCLFNAGLAHNCDYRDVIGAVNEVNHWGSDLAPGRRKRETHGYPKFNSINFFDKMVKRNRK